MIRTTGILAALFLSVCLSNLAPIDLAASQSEEQWDAERYKNNSELQYNWARKYIHKLKLAGDESVLDIGCGDGRATALLALEVPRGYVIGIDLSDSMLAASNELREKTQIPNLIFMKRDALQLGFENQFDYAVSFNCLHWVLDHRSALQEIEKCLKPGGKVFLYFAPDHGRDRFDHSIKKVVALPKWSCYFTGFSDPFSLVKPSTFAAMAEDAGLLIKRFEIITIDEPFVNKEAFFQWISGWMAHLKMLPRELQREFVEDIIDDYLQKQPPSADGKLHYIDYWLEVELIKSP